jgi:hypothetical protein
MLLEGVDLSTKVASYFKVSILLVLIWQTCATQFYLERQYYLSGGNAFDQTFRTLEKIYLTVIKPFGAFITIQTLVTVAVGGGVIMSAKCIFPFLEEGPASAPLCSRGCAGHHD